MTRLMCSQDRAEIESVKKELFRAGIRAEIRSNPLAAALRVTRLELWVHNEHDFFKASKLYAGMHDQAGKRRSEPRTRTHDTNGEEGYIEVTEVADEPREAEGGATTGPNGVGERGRGNEALEQVSALLEQEIEEMLTRERELETTCDSLRSKVKELTETLTQAQSALARETENRAAVEKKQVAEVSGLQSALEHERAGRANAEVQLDRERVELRQQLKADDEALKEAQRKLEAKVQQLQTQQATIVELRKEIVSREQEWAEHEKALSKARAEVVVERDARKAAEERAERSIAAQRSLEKELGEQKDLRQQLRLHMASLNSLRSKLQAKRSGETDAKRTD